MDFNSLSNHLGGVAPAGGGVFLPMTDTEIRFVENRVGGNFPQAYRSLLRKFGAFTFKGKSENSPYIFFRSKTLLPDYIAANGLAILDFFYGSTQQTGPQGLLQQITFFQERIPETMIPVASDGGAGQICLGIKDDDLGKVFYWDQMNEPLDEETYFEDFGEPMPAEVKRQNIYLVASSFEDFMNQLTLGRE